MRLSRLSRVYYVKVPRKRKLAARRADAQRGLEFVKRHEALAGGGMEEAELDAPAPTGE